MIQMESLHIVISAIGITAGALFLLRKYRENFQWGWCQSNRRMDGKVVIITGGNSGIGKEAAKELAHRGAIVILACRNKQSAMEAIQHIRNFTKDGDVIFVELDLSSLESVKKCAENILEKFSHIDLLVNNAGVFLPRDILDKTLDGFEMHFGVNYLGHFYLTHLLLDRIKGTEKSRIVAVSSMLYKQGAIDFENFRGERGLPQRKGRSPLYSDSKLANILHTRELYKRLSGTSVGVYSLCPGSRQGAQTTLHCVLSEELDDVPTGFFRNCKPSELSPNAKDDETSHRLWVTSMSLIEQVMK